MNANQYCAKFRSSFQRMFRDAQEYPLGRHPDSEKGTRTTRGVLRIQTSLTIAANHGVNQWDLSRSMASSHAITPYRLHGFVSDAFAGIFGRMTASVQDRRACLAASPHLARAAGVLACGL